MFLHIAIDDELHTIRFYEQITYILLVILLNWNHVDFTNKVRTKISTSYIQIKGEFYCALKLKSELLDGLLVYIQLFLQCELLS